MDIAPINPAPSNLRVAQDRERGHYAAIGAGALLIGIWLCWLGAWALGWSMGDLGVVPRHAGGLIGILTAPFAHASFEHLMSNTLPLAMLTLLILYVYPRAARFALPLIWIGSGLGVWLFARESTHIGASGITHGFMFFLFVAGLLRRDRLAVVTSLVVFFLYGSMLMTILPREEHISFEYHFFGALFGVIAAIAFRRLDPLPPRKRYSWEDEDENLTPVDDEFEPPRPADVPVLWDGPQRRPEPVARGQVIAFPGERPGEGEAARSAPHRSEQ
jgi:membrane associated rhomboid family serine protease